MPSFASADHHVEHLVDHLRVERRGRLVEQHGDRVHRQRARDGDALLLAAGELAGKLVLVREQADAIEAASDRASSRFLAAAAEHLDLREGQVLADRHVREELEVLEHHADARAQLRQVGLRIADRDAVDRDLALLERLEAVHALDQRGLAGARGPQTTTTSPLATSVRAVGEHLEAAVPLADVLDGRSSVMDSIPSADDGDPALQPLAPAATAQKQMHEVDDRHEQVHLDQAAVALRDLGGRAEEVGGREHVDERGVLEQDDRLREQHRQHVAERLRQHDVAHRLPVVQPERVAGRRPGRAGSTGCRRA